MFALAFLAPAFAAAPWTCTVDNTTTTVLLDSDGNQTLYDLAMHGWEPKPLLDDWIVTTKDGCITATFAVHTLTGYTATNPPLLVGDDYAAFQVIIDGNPMYGHTTACTDPKGNFVACVVFSHGVDAATTIDGHAYNFVYPAVAGKHHIEVYYAGLDATGSVERGAYVGGTILTLHYR